METKRRNFTDDEIEAAWKKGKVVPPNDPNVYRKDYAGAWIRKDQYGQEKEYGWVVDHRNPLSNGGTYNPRNLEPLHWRNNKTKYDNYPHWKTSVTADGQKNVECEQEWDA